MAKIETIYHSKLTTPTRVTVRHERKASKFSGKPDYVGLKIDGKEWNYNAENEACAAFFDGTTNRTFTIIAKGREEDAEIIYVGEDASDGTAQSPPAQRKGQQRQAPPAATHPSQLPTTGAEPRDDDAALRELKKFVGRNLVLCQLALKASRAVRLQYEAEHKEPMPDAMYAPLFSAMCYGASNTGLIPRLPLQVDYATLKAVHREAAQQAPPPPQPDEDEDDVPM